jgi:hypothetical protein
VNNPFPIIFSPAVSDHHGDRNGGTQKNGQSHRIGDDFLDSCEENFFHQ